MKTSGSKLPLAMLCPASMALPWIGEPPRERTVRGSVVHAFLEAVNQYVLAGATREDARTLALEDAPVEAHLYLRSLDLDALAEYLELTPELAFGLDWRNRTARVLGSGLGRQYPPLPPTEIPLTVDLVGLNANRVRVSDYKTGRTRYGDPAKFPQLLAGALAACWAFDRQEALVELVYLDDMGEPRVARGELDAWALESAADELARTMLEVQKGEVLVARGQFPDVRPGDHCQDLYCPAYKACPAKSALVRHMPEHIEEIQAPGYLAPTRLARTWHQIQEAQKILGMIEQEIEALSFREPIDLGDGTMLGPREREVETLSAGVAHAVLAEMLSPEHATAALKVKVAKTAIEEQAKRYRNAQTGPRIKLETAKGDGLLDRIYAEIRARGGAEVKVTNNPTVYKKKD